MKTVRFGLTGLGRLGYEHARNLVRGIPEATLVAVCDEDQDRVEQICTELNVPFGFTDYSELCASEELDAIIIASPSEVCMDEVAQALEAGKHVFCDKPFGMSVRQWRQAEAIIEAYPDKAFMLGFVWRYDDGCRAAKRLIENGDIGKVVLLRSYTQDPQSSDAVVQETAAPCSGAEYLEVCAHDVDLVRWYTGSMPKNLWGIGGKYEFDLYRELRDGDSVAIMMQCENDAMAFLYAGCAYTQGCNVETEVLGTKGTLRICSVSNDTLLEVITREGVHRERYPNALHRWHNAYLAEMREFISCILEERKPEVTIYDGTAVSEIICRCKESFECGEMLPLRDVVFAPAKAVVW